MPEGIGAPLTASPEDVQRKDKSIGASCTIKLPNPEGSHTQIHIPSLKGGSSYTVASPADGREIRIDFVNSRSEGRNAHSSGQNLSDAKEKFYYAVFLRLLSYLTKGGYAQATGYRPGGLPAGYMLLGVTWLVQVLMYVVTRNYLFPVIKHLAGIEKDFSDSSRDLLNSSLYAAISIALYALVSEISYLSTKKYFKQGLLAVDCNELGDQVRSLIDNPDALQQIKTYVLDHVDLKLLSNSGRIDDEELIILYLHDFLKWGSRSKRPNQSLLAGFALANLEEVLNENKRYIGLGGSCSRNLDVAIRRFGQSFLHLRIYTSKGIGALAYAKQIELVDYDGVEPLQLEALSIRGVLNPGGLLPAYLLKKFIYYIPELEVSEELLRNAITNQIKHAFITKHSTTVSSEFATSLVDKIEAFCQGNRQEVMHDDSLEYDCNDFLKYVRQNSDSMFIVMNENSQHNLVRDLNKQKKHFLKQLLVVTSLYIVDVKINSWSNLDQSCCASLERSYSSAKVACSGKLRDCCDFWSSCCNRNEAHRKKIKAAEFEIIPLACHAGV